MATELQKVSEYTNRMTTPANFPLTQEMRTRLSEQRSLPNGELGMPGGGNSSGGK